MAPHAHLNQLYSDSNAFWDSLVIICNFEVKQFSEEEIDEGVTDENDEELNRSVLAVGHTAM